MANRIAAQTWRPLWPPPLCCSIYFPGRDRQILVYSLWHVRRRHRHQFSSLGLFCRCRQWDQPGQLSLRRRQDFKCRGQSGIIPVWPHFPPHSVILSLILIGTTTLLLSMKLVSGKKNQGLSFLRPQDAKGETLFSRKGKYYFLPGRSHIVSLRQQREQFSKTKWLIARRVGEQLKKFPFIIAIFVTGALAMNNCPKDDDIDLMLVTYPNTLWITRFSSIYIYGASAASLAKPLLPTKSAPIYGSTPTVSG